MSALLSTTASENVASTQSLKGSSTLFRNATDISCSNHTINNSQRLHVLLVDQNALVRKACSEIAESSDFTVTGTGSLEIARRVLKQRETAIVLLDVSRPDNGCMALLEETKVLHPDTAVIVMSARASIEAAVNSMRSGACDYLSKPFPLNVLTDALVRAAKRWHFSIERRRLQKTLQPAGMIDTLGKSVEMEKLYRILSNVTKSTHPVMLLGENGTGKSLLAQSIHDNGLHSAKPFTSIDCASLGPDLLESSLFGKAAGSIDMADLRNHGLLNSSNGGTVFIDEIGDLPLDLQARLFKALTAKESQRNECTVEAHLTVRIIAATSRDLTTMVKEGLFRMDLFRLLSVVNLRIPPLRGRPDDILFLAKRFLEKIQQESGLTRTLSKETLDMLETYDWPENIRELEDSLTTACSHSSSLELEPDHLPQKLLRFHKKFKGESLVGTDSTEDFDRAPSYRTILPIAKVEKQAILEAIWQTHGDKLMAAGLLGIGKTTLYRKLKEYGYSEVVNIDPDLILPAEAAHNHVVCA
jgi:DNA-binding NtrC family response regulator